MDLLTILVVVLIIALLFGGYGYRAGWYDGTPGYYAPSGIGIVVVIILVLILLRALHMI